MSGRYTNYPKYKYSGIEVIGEIPVSWVLARLKQVVDQNRQITYGIVQAGPNKKGGIPYIRPADMTEENGVKSVDNLLRTSPSIAADFERSKIKLGDIICSIGPSFGKLMITPESLDGANLTQGTARIAISADYHFRYFFWALRSTFSYQQWESCVGGATFRALNLGPLADTYLAVPSSLEQVKIANFLDHETAKIDTLIEKQQLLIKLLKEKRQAVISHAVTKGLNPDAPMRESGVEWLGEVPDQWIKKIKLSKLAESNRGSFVNGPFGSDLLADELKDEGVPVVYIRDINRTGYKRKSTVCVTPKKAEQLKVCKVVSGDVIISKVGDPPGDACIYPEGEPDAIITQDVIRIRVDNSLVNPKYLVILLNSDFGQMAINDISVEGTRKRVSLGDFKATKFVIPPLNDQDAIVDFVSRQWIKIDALIEKSENAVSLINERRTALISAAVTGKIDVRNWQTPEHSSRQKNRNKDVIS